MSIDLITTPQRHHLDKLWTQLKHEEDTGQVGFYCNRNLIAKGIENGDLYCLVAGGEVVGFSLCSQYELTGRLEIVEVLASYRSSGYGRVLVESSLAELRARGVLVVELECAPSDSEAFWRHMGFIDLTPGADPNDRFRTPNPYSNAKLYSPIVASSQAGPMTSVVGDTLTVELWQVEPWEAGKQPATWHWSVLMDDSGNLQRPIIHSANKDWRVRVTRGQQPIYDGKVKRLSDESYRWAYHLIVVSLKSIRITECFEE